MKWLIVSKFKIKNLTFYSFLTLLAGIFLSVSIIIFYLYKIKALDDRLKKVADAHSTLLELKLNTEKLLTTSDLNSITQNWLESSTKFNQAYTKLTQQHKEKINIFWNLSTEKIDSINLLLQNEIFNNQNLHDKPLLFKQGELSLSQQNTTLYTTITDLSKQIQTLIQYESSLLDIFNTIETQDIKNIKNNIKTTTAYAIFIPLFILIVAIFLVIYTTRRISTMEDTLLKTQANFSHSITQLQDSQLLLNNIIDSVPMGIFWKDTQCIYLGANKQFLEDVGYTKKDEIIGKNDFELPWGDIEAQQYIDDDKAVMKSGKAILQFEETHTYNDGTVITLITSKVPLKNTKGELIGILGSYLDITEQKKASEELEQKNRLLEQQSKMAAMGEMLENIAHQWRQPLSVISTASSGIKMQKQFHLLDDESMFKTLDTITQTAEHLSQTINDFRDYFKPNKKVELFDVTKVIDKTLYFLQSKFKNRDIKVIKEFQDISFIGLENELVQVIMNILNNSRDAFENETIDNEKLIFIKSFQNQKEKMIYITITDTAGGIPEKIISRVFEPYFTTKHKSQGTGIGLYMSKEMVEKHMEGTLDVQNTVFQYQNQKYSGAIFTIALPIVS